MAAPVEPVRSGEIRRILRALCSLGLLVLFSYATWTVVRTPCLGVADIQDFWRVMKPAGIEHVSDLEAPGYYVRCEFRTIGSDLLSAPSSSALLAWLARFVPGHFAARADSFALRQMGMLNLALVAIFIAGGLALGLHPGIALALLYVLVDPGYLLFFNSFYADSTLFLALLGTTLWLERAGDLSAAIWKSRRRIAVAWIAVLTVLALSGGGSKMQYVPYPLLILVTLLPLMFAGGRVAWRRAVSLASALALVALLVAWNFFEGPGPRFPEFNNFHAVFGGILRVAEDPEKVLADLDIPREHWNLPRTDAWSAQVGVDHPLHRHLRHLSRLRLLGIYMGDPQARRMSAESVATHLLQVSSHPRGTYEMAPGDVGPVRRTYAVAWQFSRWTRAALARWPSSIWAILIGCACWLGASVLARRWDGRKSALLFLLLWIASETAVAILGEGFVNLHQHLVGVRLGFDFLMILLLTDVAVALHARMRPQSQSRSQAAQYPEPVDA